MRDAALYNRGPWSGTTAGCGFVVVLCLFLVGNGRSFSQAKKSVSRPPRAVAQDAARDPRTIALWLFDDTPYANVTLTDAGPHQIDLRLETGQTKPLPRSMLDGSRGLVPGKFGRALSLPVGEGAGVSWPGNSWYHYGTSRMSERGDDVPERCNLGYLDFTLEFWFRASGAQAARGVVWELRNEKQDKELRYVAHGFNALVLDAGRSRFLLLSRTAGVRTHSLELAIPTEPSKLNDGGWHHLAFTFTAAERQMRHYVDGKAQPLPGKGAFLPLMGLLTSMRVGRDVEGRQEIEGLLDEMRISSDVRYRETFTPPASFSHNYGPNATGAPGPSGPPLLFDGGKAAFTVDLGTRKHVFLDDVLLDRQEGVALTANPPTKFDVTDFRNDRPWEPTPRFGAAVSDIAGIWDDGDGLGMIYTNGGMWGGKPHAVCFATSRDGLRWVKPELTFWPWDRTLPTNIVLRDASQGAAFRDPNPAAPASERYKYVAWCMNRGFYVFTSGDARRWRRNETIALPLDPDGAIGCFWDDQRGVYQGYLRALMPPNSFRAIVRAECSEILKGWPFKPAEKPLWHVFAMPKPASGELPLIDTGGEVYRFYASKYAGAPDAYVGFPWRYVREVNVRPGSVLMTSRDGATWRRYEPPYYFKPGWVLEGRTVLEALMEPGMILRGDEVWQYGTVRFTEHGGVLYGGVEHDGGYHDRLLRIVQRLDGFVSLDAGASPGTAVTRPLRFAGDRLTLNVASKGRVRVALQDEAGNGIPGFGVDDCDPIRGDSVRHLVTWKKSADLSRLAGKTVRIRFELSDAKLYALQFK